ncbi:MAG: MFS transporter [Dehalococcoidia bacterium]|jgi:MFS family permease
MEAHGLSFSKRFLIPCIIYGLQSMSMWSILTYVTIYWIDIGFSHFQVGLLISIFTLMSLLLMIPIGVFVDRISPKKLVSISHVIFGLGIVGLMTAREFWPTLLWVAVAGTGYALFNNALPSLYYKTLGSKFRGLKLGYLNAALLIGYGLGPLLSGYILSAFTMNEVFIFALLVLVPSFIMCIFLADVPGTSVQISDYKADLSNKSVLIFILLVFAFSLHAGAEQSSLSLFLNKEVGLNDEMVGWLFFIHANVMAVLAVLDGFLGDRLSSGGKGLAKLYYVGIAISGVTNILLGFTGTFATVLGTRLMHAVGDSIVMVTRSLIISNLFVATRMGGNLGTITATVTLATLVGSIVSGAVPGYASGFVIAGALALLSIPVAILAKPKF